MTIERGRVNLDRVDMRLQDKAPAASALAVSLNLSFLS